MKHIAYFITLFFLLTSCATGEILEKQNLSVKLGNNPSELTFIKDIFTAKEWIVLDSCREGIVSNTDKIECDSNSIYILDKIKGQCVYRFSKSGKFCNKIGTRGNGSGEYTQIFDFTINPKNGRIIILGNNSKVYIYDKEGRFVSSKSVAKANLWNIQATNNSIFMSTNHSTYTSGDDSYLIYEFDFDFNVIGKWNHVLPQYTGVIPMSSFVFQNDGNEISYIDQKQNSIFIYNNDDKSFNNYISIEFPNPRPTSHYEDAMAFMQNENQKKYDWLCEVIRGKDKMLITYFHEGKYCISVIDAKDGKVIKESIWVGTKPHIYPVGEDEFIAAITPENYNMDDSWRAFPQTPKQNITEESNMLLVRLKLK